MTEADFIACDHSAAFAPDRIVRLVATDGYQVHRLIYEALAKDGVRDFLKKNRKHQTIWTGDNQYIMRVRTRTR